MYIFNISLDFEGVPGTANVLYPCEISFANEHFRSAISEVTNNRLPASKILIVCPIGLEDCIKSEYDGLGYSKSQTTSISHIVVLPYGINGSLCKDKIVFLHGNNLSISDNILTRIAQECIATTLPKTSYRLCPPHGYKFRKPSGKRVDLFLRAGNMLSKPDLLLPFCYLLLCKLPKTVRTIYIDSFTILSFALRIQSLISHFSRQVCGKSLIIPSIEVFRSYDVDTEFRLPNSEDYYIVISASSSNDLLKKLVNHHSANSSKIVHLLGVSPSGSELSNNSIHFIDEQVDTSKVSPTKEIGISTEEFMISHGNPIRVLLTMKHVCREHADELGDKFYQKCLQISLSGQEVGYGPCSTFSMRTDTQHNWSERFSTWIKQTVSFEIPIITGAIIHLDDPMSKKMAEEISDHEFFENRILKISCSELDNFNSRLQNCSSVTVVAFQDPGLHQFGIIAIKLRKYLKLHRNFILGYAFPETEEQFNRMVSDIRHAPKLVPKYRFSKFFVFPVGSLNSHESIRNDYGINHDQLENLDPDIHPNVIERMKQGIRFSVFFPSLDGNNLQLRHGSIFFSSNRNCDIEHEKSTISQNVVYLAVTLALQHARNPNNNLPNNLTFDSNPYIKSVIDPKMFWRYNDGILQAAMLRALSPSELDFAASTEMSAQFREIAIAILTDAENSNGEAAIEIVAAVASKKVQLTDDDFNEIKRKVQSNPKLNSLWDIFTVDRPF